MDATIRISSYDPKNRTFKGDGKFVNLQVGVSTDLVIEGKVGENRKIEMTTHHFGGLASGRSYTFDLQYRDGELYGTDRTRSATLTLKKAP